MNNNKSDVIILNGSRLKWRLVSSFSVQRQYNTENFDPEIDEDFNIVVEYSDAEVFYNKSSNNCIVFEQYRLEDEPFLDRAAEITNHTEAQAYEKLIKYLNTHKGITVHWTQVCDTSADYTILDNLPFDRLSIDLENESNLLPVRKLSDIIATTKAEDKEHSYKYTIIKADGIRRKF